MQFHRKLAGTVTALKPDPPTSTKSTDQLRKVRTTICLWDDYVPSTYQVFSKGGDKRGHIVADTKCFPVCPSTEHLLRTQHLCFGFLSETFCVRNKCFSVCSPKEASLETVLPFATTSNVNPSVIFTFYLLISNRQHRPTAATVTYQRAGNTYPRRTPSKHCEFGRNVFF